MVPITQTPAIDNASRYFSQLGELRLPGKERELILQSPTDYGPIEISVTQLGNNVQDIKDQISGLVARNQLVTANPQVLKDIYAHGPRVHGVGTVSFQWPHGEISQSMQAPAANMGAGASRKILMAVHDLYNNQVIPTLNRMNPNAGVLLMNEPTSLSRASIYQRMGGMGPLDPMGGQYSMVLPTGQQKPLELFGGGTPTWLQR